jgi:glycosyltransferase involved in cell wall biosynthesis
VISILLASYNGEKYIKEQIESLLAQTMQDFKLFINDDRSTDGTFAIISKYAEMYPEKITASQNEGNSGGAKHNFMKMMIKHKDDYIMLCDQDDVWLPEKIEKSLKKIREMEALYGKGTPLMSYADLAVTDENLNVIAPSYQKMSNKCFSKNAVRNLLTMNVAAGCTQIYNRALADLFSAEPVFMEAHDWWAALTVSVFGKADTVPEPVILYRQHGNNDIGAKKTLSFRYILYVVKNLDKMTGIINGSYRQAGSLLQLYGPILSEAQKEMLGAYASVPSLSRMGRLGTVFKYKTFMHGTARKTAQIMILLKERRVDR